MGPAPLTARALIWVTAAAIVPFSATVMLADWPACLIFRPGWIELKPVSVSSISRSPGEAKTLRISKLLFWSHRGR
jgi:hypothetical protein